jgi:hypothetical protein
LQRRLILFSQGEKSGISFVHQTLLTLRQRPFVCPDRTCRKAFIQRSQSSHFSQAKVSYRPEPGALSVHIRVHTGQLLVPDESAADDLCAKARSLTDAPCAIELSPTPAPWPGTDGSSRSRIIYQASSHDLDVSTGARPFRCTIRDCSKSFCRKVRLGLAKRDERLKYCFRAL